jgi:outer membrane protein assembly factor BamB
VITKFTASLAPTYANGMLYTGAVDGSVNAIDALSGQIRWSFLTKGQVLSGPCVIDVGGKAHHPTESGDQE